MKEMNGHNTQTLEGIPAVFNRSKTEISYLERRERLLSSLTATDVLSAPFVFTDRQMLTKSLTRVHLFEKILDVQGSIVECGVHRGNSLFLYYHLSTIFEPYNFNRKIIGFDTFEGFRSISERDDKDISASDFADSDYVRLAEWAELSDTNRAASHIPKLELVDGDATKTIPQYVEDNPHLIIAMLYLDFDLYAPTAAALEYLLPLVPKGGIVGFDEVNCKKWQGETIALKEKLRLGDIRLQKFVYDPWVSYYVVE